MLLRVLCSLLQASRLTWGTGSEAFGCRSACVRVRFQLPIPRLPFREGSLVGPDGQTSGQLDLGRYSLITAKLGTEGHYVKKLLSCLLPERTPHKASPRLTQSLETLLCVSRSILPFGNMFLFCLFFKFTSFLSLYSILSFTFIIIIFFFFFLIYSVWELFEFGVLRSQYFKKCIPTQLLRLHCAVFPAS
jgi:hypothetical protein